MYHLPWLGLDCCIYNIRPNRKITGLILILCNPHSLPAAHDSRIYHLQVNHACLTGHDRQAGMFIHPAVAVVAIIHLKLHFPYNLRNILEPFMVRVLPQNQHPVIHQTDIPDILYELHPGAFCCPVPVKYLKEGSGREIAHLIAVAYDVNGLAEYSVTISSVGLLSQGIVPQLIGPEIQLGIIRPVKQLHGKHEYHIAGKGGSPGPKPFQIQLRLHPLCQFSIHISQK